MRVIVTGPRGWKGDRYYRALFTEMDKLRTDLSVPADEVITLVEGEAKGFDSMARLIGQALGWVIEPYPIESWYPGGVFNPNAGHMRNQNMVDSGGDVALAGLMRCEKPEHAKQPEHITHGTVDCIERLEDAGIPIVKVNPDGI